VGAITNYSKKAALASLPGLRVPHQGILFVDVEPSTEQAAQALNPFLASLGPCRVYLYAQGHRHSSSSFVRNIAVPPGVTLVYAIPTYGGTRPGGVEGVVRALEAIRRPFVLLQKEGPLQGPFQPFTTSPMYQGYALYIPIRR